MERLVHTSGANAVIGVEAALDLRDREIGLAIVGTAARLVPLF